MNRRLWKHRILPLLLGMMLLMVALGGCAQQPVNEGNQPGGNIGASTYPLTVVDGLGNEITIEKKPERLISVSPSQTELLFALGLGDKVVGVSNYCDYPAEALEKEKVGSAWTMNTERILELEPDIVFVYGEGEPAAVELLQQAGIVVMKYEPESIQEILDSIKTIGTVAGIEEQAEALIQEMETRRDEIVEKVKGAPPLRVFYQLWDEPLMTGGKGSYIDELIRLAGGENIADDGLGAYPQYSVETMLEKDPEVYLAPAVLMSESGGVDVITEEDLKAMEESIRNRPGYQDMTAVVNDRIHLLDPDITSRPGARIIDALELFAKAIHPERFE